MDNKITLESGLSFELNRNDSTAKIIYSPRARGYLNIPRSIKYKNNEFIITSIQKGSFKNNKKIKSITFDDDSSLLSIEKNSFKFSKIQSLNLPSSVNDLQEGWCNHTPKLISVSISPQNLNFKYIDDKHQILAKKSDKTTENYDVIIFANRNIERVIIPSSIKRIESYSFDQCKKLEFIEIPENSELQSIQKNSFSNSMIKHLFIPSKVNDLQEGWCNYTPKLISVSISPQNPNFKYIDDTHQILAKKSDKKTENYDVIIFANRNIRYITIPESVTCIDSCSFDCCINLQFIEIPENSNLKKICKKAFKHTSFKKIFIPSKVEEIQEDWIFCNFSLTKVLVSTQNPHFKYMDENQQIILGKSDKNSQIFDLIIWSNKEIEKVSIPSSIKQIYSFSFFSCNNLKKVKFERNSQLQKIGCSAFYSSAIEKITIPKSVTKIGESAFEWCRSLRYFKLEKGTKLQKISDRMLVFSDNIQKVEIPEDSIIQSIGVNAFGETKIDSLYIPATVEEMKEGWCFWTPNLDSITISPHNKNFAYLDDSHQIIVEKSHLDKDIFDSIIFANRNINNVVIPDFIKEINSYAFKDCCNLKEISISENSELLLIGEESFGDIKELFIPPKVEILEKGWTCSLPDDIKIVISPKNKNFKYLDKSQKIIVGKSDTRKVIFDDILYASKNVKTVIIPDSIKYISKYAFKNCTRIEKVEFSENSQLKSIGKYAFSESTIVEFELPKEVEKIGLSAFSGCDNLTSFKISKESKLLSIPDDFVIFCSNFENIEIPEDSVIRSFEYYSFAYSTIKSLYIPSKVDFIHEYWCENTDSLEKVSVSSENQNFKYLDEKHQIIVQKSDTGNFDNLFFANRNIIEVFIPNSILHICPNAFKNCKKLKKVTFQENSNLQFIDNNAFYSTNIKSVVVPKGVYMLSKSSFSKCKFLKSFEFLGSSLLNEFVSFKNCSNLKFVSFPNVKKLNVKLKEFNDYSLFVSANIEVEIYSA